MSARFLKCFTYLCIAIAVLLFSSNCYARQFRTAASGQWNVPSTWQYSLNGAGGPWNASPITPSLATDTTMIRTGHTVAVYNTTGSWAGPGSCGTLTVQSGAKLWANDTRPLGTANNNYISVYGNILCDGIIGNGASFDYLSFNIEGANCFISGSGTFDVSRVRKSSNTPITTNLVFAMNANLRFASSSQTQIYNNFTTGPSTFNVTVNSGFTLNLTGSGASTGNACIDGIDGFGTNERGGTFTINGTLNISGALYLTTDNLVASNNWIIGSTGVVTCSQVVAPASGPGKCFLTINSGGLLKINGINSGQSYLYNTVTYSPANGGFNAYSSTNNVFTFNQGSTVEYAGAGDQNVEASLTYSNLIFSGSGNKIIANNLTVNNNFTMTGASKLASTPYTINIGGNWNVYDNTAFTAGNSKVIFNGFNTTLQTISSADSVTFYQLELNNNVNNIQLNKPITVTNQLNLVNGLLLLNTNQLTVTAFANTAITRTNGMIVSESVTNASKVKWNFFVTNSSHTFPFGLTNGNYIPLSITKTSGSLNYVTVSTYGTPANNLPWPVSPVNVTNLLSSTLLSPDNRDATVDRFWQIDQSGSGTATFDFSYQASELPISPYNTPAAMLAQFYDGTSNQWLQAITGQSSSAYSVIVPGVTAANFGPWTISASMSPLPVQWIAFNALKQDEVVSLKWSTTSEVNNDYYTVQRSSNSIDFTDIGMVDAKLFQQQLLEYEFTDAKPLKGINYYRIRQTDLNGLSGFSNTRFIRMDKTKSSVQLGINAGNLIFYSGDKMFDNATISIADLSGRVLYKEKIKNKNENEYSINVANYSSGLYIVTLLTDDELISSKVVF